MTDLAEFLLARIAEDEEVVHHALAALDADRTEYAARIARRTGPWSTVTSSGHCGIDTGPRGTVEAIPGRALAECDAKRRIVTECGWVTVMELLALPYADHPDYREEWRP